jgi:hypothetical protein
MGWENCLVSDNTSVVNKFASLMKALIILLFCIVELKAEAQNKFVGKYRDFFASTVVVNSDSTFKYEFHFDLESSWTKGTWTANKDTIYFQMIPVFDTLKYVDANGISHDSLILSRDENAGQVAIGVSQLLSSGGQERHPCPKKLYLRRNKLYYIRPDGKLVTQKFSWGNKKLAPWFIKSREG